MTRPTATDEEVTAFTNACVYARSLYLHYQTLFQCLSQENGGGGTETAAYLYAAAPFFFGDIGQAMRENLLLQVCRFTERGAKRLSVSFFADHCVASAAGQHRLKELAMRMKGSATS